MVSSPILNFETLLAPIEGSNPAGEPLPLSVKNELISAREEINPKQFDEKDPRRPEQPKLADWPGIEQKTQEILARTSKDLTVAARLMEALVKRHGFRGLRDGLGLLRRLTEECWDRIHPGIEDGDLDTRAAPFNWLDDPFKGARFPTTLRIVPLTAAGEERFGWQHWNDIQNARGAVTAEAFDKAVADTPRETCQNIAEEIADSVKELTNLKTALRTAWREASLKLLDAQQQGEVTEERKTEWEDAAPSLGQVSKALQECQELAAQILKRKGPPPVAAAAEVAAPPATNGAAQSAEAVPANRRPLTREDILNRLSDASALLLAMEPQSPIAFMIQRAIKMARMPLPDLMKVLIRDPNVLAQLDRDLDLGLEKKPEAPKPGNK